MKRNARLYKNNSAVVAMAEKISHIQLLEQTDRLAAGIHSLGVRNGDRIAVLGKNSLQYLYLYGAAARTGAIMLPINWRLSSEEIQYILSDGAPKVIFADPEFQESTIPFIEASQHSITCFSTGRKEGLFRDFNDLMARTQVSDTGYHGHDDSCLIIHTAAIHGRPRGAVITHQGILWASLCIHRLWNLGPKDINLSMLPFFHVAGILLVSAVMIDGGCSIVMPSFDVEAALKFIEKYNATVFAEFPPMLASLLDGAQKNGCNLSSLRHVMGIDHPDTVKRFEESTGATFWAAYGQSETSGLASIGRYFDKPGSAGTQLPFSEVEIEDESGNILGESQVGEIVVRGPQVFKGYWNLKDDTEYTFRNGWHHTGDLGRIDEEGYLWFEGRASEKELIKTGGENVYPSEVENVIRQHPMVKDVAVIGVPDPQWGEAIKAVCVLDSGSHLSEADLIEFVAHRIARFKKPRHVLYVSELPKTVSGTVDRQKIKDDYGQEKM